MQFKSASDGLEHTSKEMTRIFCELCSSVVLLASIVMCLPEQMSRDLLNTCRANSPRLRTAWSYGAPNRAPVESQVVKEIALIEIG
jgi:hypothetical protein